MVYIIISFLVNGKPQPLQHDEVKEIKGELIDMRDKINDLLSRIDSFANGSGGDATVANGDASQESEKAEEASKFQFYLLFINGVLGNMAIVPES